MAHTQNICTQILSPTLLLVGTLEKAIFNPNSDFDLLLKIYRSLVLKSPFHRTKFKPVTFKLLQQQSSSSTIPRVRLATAAGLSSSSEHVEEKVAIITPYYLSCVFQQMANAFEATGSNKKDEEGQDSSYTAAAASASSSIDESSSSGSDMPRLQEAMEIKPVAISKSATETTATTRSEFTDDYSSPATLFRLFKNTEFALIPPLAHLSAMTLLINSIVADGPDFPTFLDKSHESVNEMRKQKTSLKVRRKDVELEIEAARVELEKMGKEMDRVEAMDCEAVADYSLGLIGSAMDTTSTIEAGSSLSLSALASSSSSTPSSDIISPHQPQAINQLAAFLKFLDSVDMSLEDQSALDSNETSADSQAVSPSSSTSALAFSSSSSDSIKASGAQLANNLKSERHFSINRANTIKSLTLRKRSKLNQMCKQYNADVTAFKLLEKEMESLSEELDEIDALIARSESIGRGSQSWELMGHDRFGRSYWWWCVTYGKLPAVSTSSSASSSPDKMQQKEHVSENVVDGDDVVMVVDDGDDDAFMTTTTLSSKKGTAETAPAHSGPSFRLSDNATVYQPPVFGVLVEHVSYRYETKETQVFVKRVAEKTNVSDEDDDDVDVHMEAVDEPDEEKSMGDHDTSSPSPTTISSPPTSSSSKEELVPFTVNSTEIFSSSTWQCIDSRNMFHRVVRSLNERGVHERKLRQALVDKWYEFGNTFPFKAASTVKLSIASTSTGGSSDASGAAAADQDRTSCWWIKWSKDHSFSSMNGVLSSNSAFKSDVEFVTDKAVSPQRETDEAN